MHPIYVLVVVGGTIGKGLVKRLSHQKNDFIVIDINVEVCEDIYAKFGTVTIIGNATYPAKLEDAINERTKVIIPVHIQGCPADMDPILEIARKHNLYVIENACQANGAMYKGKMCGTIGHVVVFSLNNLKNLCGSEGDLLSPMMMTYSRRLSLSAA
ncbi:DegT/DnrJ/EryC1/StrS family aminotransferase [Candidatus Latescibacterota bacterium]